MKYPKFKFHGWGALAGISLFVTSLASATWKGDIEVISNAGAAPASTVSGIVFHDKNGDSRHQAGESGIPGVKVTNGLQVTVTDPNGRYALPVRPDMDLSVVQPAGWTVPVDERMIPQFAYIHKEKGSPKELRFGGIPATGPMPSTVNFPLRPHETGYSHRAAVIGDSQTYSNMEVGYFRDSTVKDLLNLDGTDPAFLLYVGDVMGDDLGLLHRLLEVASTVGVPQWLVHGNHDLDFDAESDADSSDSWRNLYGPNYYAFEYGKALYVILDNVVYPCGPEDMQLPDREFCDNPERPTYNGRVPDRQMEWLENLLAATPEDRIVIFAHHIPFVSFADPDSTKHQTDNLMDIYNLVDGREALSLSGHTHTLENHAPGQMFDGWDRAVNIQGLAFRHIVAGAASGSWYNGDLNYRGVPMSFQRLGSPKGVLLLDIEGTQTAERYLGAGVSQDQAMWVSLNTPDFRNWYTTLVDWSREASREERMTQAPPLSINDLGDNLLVRQDELVEGTWLTANIWAASAENSVRVSLNGADPVPMQRTQSGNGDSVRVGAEWADPFAAQRQLSVARFAYRSQSGNERNQGYEAFKGSRFGPAAPQPMGRLADRNMHLWRWKLPEDLPLGAHVAEVISMDRNGQISREQITFEIVTEEPALRWRHELWD